VFGCAFGWAVFFRMMVDFAVWFEGWDRLIRVLGCLFVN